MFLQTVKKKKKINVVEEEILSRCSCPWHSMGMAAQQPGEQRAGSTHCVCTGSTTKRCVFSCGAASLCNLSCAAFKHSQLHMFMPSGDSCPTGHSGTLLFIWTRGLTYHGRAFQPPLGEGRNLFLLSIAFNTRNPLLEMPARRGSVLGLCDLVSNGLLSLALILMENRLRNRMRNRMRSSCC